MEPKRLGRVLGISARIAAKKIGERTAQAGQSVPTPAAAQAAARTAAAQIGATRKEAEQTARVAADSGRRFARGAGRAGAALMKPFAHAGGILALEIFGVFFAVFAFSFLAHAWQAAKATGWHERHAEAYLGVGLVFLWFAVSSFWRAKRKQRAGSG
ncbi:MAG TPA: hypothetical protein VJV22_18795 [Acidobacteriaceae bacterium]|nr:hypothetical protein [Acidobacteriaceae bacterium]